MDSPAIVLDWADENIITGNLDFKTTYPTAINYQILTSFVDIGCLRWWKLGLESLPVKADLA